MLHKKGNKTRLFFACVALVAGLWGLLPARTADAATIVVQTAADTDTSGASCPGPGCSLRDAIAAASPGDTITFNGDFTITLASTLTIGKDLTINGAGHVVFINGNDAVQVFIVNSGVTASLNNLRKASGRAGSSGGGIYNSGTLTMRSSTLSGNFANIGGGIFNKSTLAMTNSALSDNSGGIEGGCIYNDVGGTLTLTNSTLSGNSAPHGGGIANYAILRYTNTIIANSTIGGDCVNSGGFILTNTNNLVEDGGCSPSFSGDPKLGPLGNYGGPTQTFALLPSSPAIDAGDDAACAAAPVSNLDQRGVTRPQGTHCDIGAYELDTTAPTVVSFTAISPSSSLNIPITAFSASDTGGVTGYMITHSSTPPGYADAGWSGAAPITYTVTSAGSYTLYPWAKDATGNVSSVFGSPATVTVCYPSVTVTNANDTGAGSLRQALADLCEGGRSPSMATSPSPLQAP